MMMLMVKGQHLNMAEMKSISYLQELIIDGEAGTERSEWRVGGVSGEIQILIFELQKNWCPSVPPPNKTEK